MTFNISTSLPRLQALQGLQDDLALFPAVALLGPRQCGKTTLAKQILAQHPDAIYLDLERPSNRERLRDPELLLPTWQDRLVCLDEVQLVPELFPVLRSLIDEHRRPGRFLLLGSASQDLIRQGAETLAGRIGIQELTPFQVPEILSLDPSIGDRHWLRGGYPVSLLTSSESASFRWRENFIDTFLHRDLAQFGIGAAPDALDRFWRMSAHLHGQELNLSRLGQSLGVSHPTVRSYTDILVGAFMLRYLPPCLPNLGKSLVKSPRVYVRDSGLLHTLLDIESRDALLGHPICGPSWEGLVIEECCRALPQWKASFYRTQGGAEIDLILERGLRRIAIECKASSAPQVTRGFWSALDDLKPEAAFIAAPISGDPYPIKSSLPECPVSVTNLSSLLCSLKKLASTKA